jgi:hypothetical protein
MKPEDEFQFVEASQVEFVRRGRKSNVDQKVVDNLRKLKQGGALILTGLKQNPNADTYQNDKSRTAGQIRTACGLAGLARGQYRILWTPTGVPQVVRK